MDTITTEIENHSIEDGLKKLLESMNTSLITDQYGNIKNIFIFGEKKQPATAADKEGAIDLSSKTVDMEKNISPSGGEYPYVIDPEVHPAFKSSKISPSGRDVYPLPINQTIARRFDAKKLSPSGESPEIDRSVAKRFIIPKGEGKNRSPSGGRPERVEVYELDGSPPAMIVVDQNE
jgi:hypothetical protein